MPSPKPGQRPLRLSRLDEVMPEVDRLLSTGYCAAGDWSLGQICNHLSLWLFWSIEGGPPPAPWPVRVTRGRRLARRIFRDGAIDPGTAAPRGSIPRPGLDDRAEAEALRASIRLFLGHAGEFAPHPLLGRLDAGRWQLVHAVHAAHHLGFVSPTPAG